MGGLGRYNKIGTATAWPDCASIWASVNNNPEEILKISTRDEAEAAGAQIAALHIQINEATAKQNRVSFAAQKLNARIADLRQRMARYEQALRTWAEANRPLLFSTQKTLIMRHVELAFKSSRPAVKFLEGWTLPKILAKLRRSKKLRTYIRIKEELDRVRILNDARPEVGCLKAETMRKFGVAIGQEEHFYVEPRLEPAK